ncbi:MAG: glutathione S-transferase [Oligoflexia bacterium]|nr:glutathione S-transferase [Oligoflexia bacterium]
MKLYGFGPSRSARYLWTLLELGVPFERVDVDLSKGEHGRPDFLALNPMGRVPVLVAGDLVLTESFAICTWLADRHPDRGLIPAPGSADRGQHDRWMFFCATAKTGVFSDHCTIRDGAYLAFSASNWAWVYTPISSICFASSSRWMAMSREMKLGL